MPWPDDDDEPRRNLPVVVETHWWEETDQERQDRILRRERWGDRDRRHREERDRFYCPSCGCVWAGYYSVPDGGWVVMPHHRYQAGGNQYYFEYVECDGGLVDPDKDRAP